MSTDSPLEPPKKHLSKVLFVDDEQPILSSFRRLTSRENFLPFFASSSAIAVQLFDQHDFDLLVCDLNIPNINGFQLINRFRSIRPELAIIVVSGHAERQDLITLINQEHIDFFIDKPWENENLLSCIKDVLHKTTLKHQKQQLNQQVLQDLRELAGIDNLTQSVSETKVQELLDQQIASFSRYQDDFSIVLLEIDRFSEQFDMFDKPAAEETLIKITNLVRSRIRVMDVLGRLDISRFILILPHTNRVNALIFAEDMRLIFEKQSYSDNRHITCSFGIATYDAANIEKSQLIENAEDALNQAIQSGGNYVVASNDIKS